MKIIHSLNQIKKFKRPVVVLGVFDGVHQGHRYILKNAVRQARRIKGISVVVTFWPHPQREESLYSLEHRLRLIAQQGIDVCIVINFNPRFAQISADDFIRDILFKKIQALHIYVGENFRFGKNAKGNFKTLQKLSRVYNFKLKVFKVITTDNRPISSTYIRNLIKQGRLSVAERLLSHPVSVLGTVIRGSSLGKRLGFPTANINPHHEVLPPHGVYIVKVIFNHKKLKGICYIGTKPTFKSQIANRISHIAKNIEVYIFNFHKNIYGKYLEIQFIKKIREEKKFTSSCALAQQVKKDIKFSKGYFSHHY